MSEYYKILEGIKINALGDSYLQGDKLDSRYTWPTLISEKYGIEFANHGKNGSTMSDLVNASRSMIERLKDMPDNNPDIVMLEGGRNDYNKSVPIGEDGSLDTKTMKGAARYLIINLKKKYPNAKFIAMTCWEVGGSPNSAGNMCSDYGRALLSVCEEFGIECINGLDQDSVGVYMTDPEFRKKYCQHENDISHLNAEGMKYILPMFEKRFAELLSK